MASHAIISPDLLRFESSVENQPLYDSPWLRKAIDSLASILWLKSTRCRHKHYYSGHRRVPSLFREWHAELYSVNLLQSTSSGGSGTVRSQRPRVAFKKPRVFGAYMIKCKHFRWNCIGLLYPILEQKRGQKEDLCHLSFFKTHHRSMLTRNLCAGR